MTRIPFEVHACTGCGLSLCPNCSAGHTQGRRCEERVFRRLGPSLDDINAADAALFRLQTSPAMIYGGDIEELILLRELILKLKAVAGA